MKAKPKAARAAASILLISLFALASISAGGFAAPNSPSIFSSFVSFVSGFFPITGYITPGPGPGGGLAQYYQLTVSVSGIGKVTTTGIDCGGSWWTDCFESYLASSGASVTLTATAKGGSTFTGWSGACSGANPTCTITMNSAKTVTATFTGGTTKFLTVTKAGTGTGTVTSEGIAGIDCGADCTENYPTNEQITLTATQSPDSTFSIWSGACGPTDCTVNLNADKTATVVFTSKSVIVTAAHSPASPAAGQLVTFTASSGDIYSPGIKEIRIYVDSSVTPSKICSFASPTAGTATCTYQTSALASGSHTYFATAKNANDLSGTSGANTVIVGAAYALTVSKSGTGIGTITSSPAGINCGTDCAESYASGASVTLTASPAGGSTFGGWSGACTGTGACTVSMTAVKSVAATFSIVEIQLPGGLPTQSLSISKTGTGTVTSSPAGIDCGTDCSESFNAGSSVILTAAPSAGYAFSSWSGVCSGTSATCTVTMDSAGTLPPKGATASFAPAVAVNTPITVYGVGETVSIIAIGTLPKLKQIAIYVDGALAKTCNNPVASLPLYPLPFCIYSTSYPAKGIHSFYATATDQNDIVGRDPATLIKGFSVFTKFGLTLTKSGVGGGTVTSSPAGVNCGAGCTSQSFSFIEGRKVNLTAVPDDDSDFEKWTSGDCALTTAQSLNPICTVTMASAKTTDAKFIETKTCKQAIVFSLSKTKVRPGEQVTPTVTFEKAALICGNAVVKFFRGE